MRTAWLLLLLVACGPSEGKARSYLKEQGIEVTEIKKSGDSFEFVGTKGDNVCKGTVTIDGGTSSFTSTCQRDPSRCKPGATAVCMEIAGELYGQDPGLPKAAELYRIACGDGNALACARAGEYEGRVERWDKAREYSKKGCELNEGDACTLLGITELQGLGTAKNPTKALELFQKGCEAKSLKGCRNLAGRLADQDPPDLPGALAAAEVACKGKFQDSCFVLGIVLFKQKEYPRALTLLEAFCKDSKEAKRGAACAVAGAIVNDGLGMPKDEGRALAFFQQSCDVDHVDGCSNLAKNHKDKAKAADAKAKACKLGDKDSC